MKIEILKILALSSEAKTLMSFYRLEKIANINSSEQVIGGNFLALLNDMANEELISIEPGKAICHITKNGLDFLKTN